MSFCKELTGYDWCCWNGKDVVHWGLNMDKDGFDLHYPDKEIHIRVMYSEIAPDFDSDTLDWLPISKKGMVNFKKLKNKDKKGLITYMRKTFTRLKSFNYE